MKSSAKFQRVPAEIFRISLKFDQTLISEISSNIRAANISLVRAFLRNLEENRQNVRRGPKVFSKRFGMFLKDSTKLAICPFDYSRYY